MNAQISTHKSLQYSVVHNSKKLQICSVVIIGHTTFKDYNILTAINSSTKEYCHRKVSMTHLNGNTIFEII